MNWDLCHRQRYSLPSSTIIIVVASHGRGRKSPSQSQISTVAGRLVSRLGESRCGCELLLIVGVASRRCGCICPCFPSTARRERSQGLSERRGIQVVGTWMSLWILRCTCWSSCILCPSYHHITPSLTLNPHFSRQVSSGTHITEGRGGWCHWWVAGWQDLLEMC